MNYQLAAYFEILDWDSDFFKFKVARLKNNISLTKNVFEELNNGQIKLAYYASSSPLMDFSNEFYTVKFVDKRVTLIKEIEPYVIHENIEPYLEEYPTKQLIDLAIECGIYSRFNIDPKIGREKYEELYTQWLHKSISRAIADEVFVYKEGKEILGFITIGQKDNRATPGILAVDKNHRGKGIGSALINAAENYYSKKLKLIQYITQGNNKIAVTLYQNVGCKIESVAYIYHLWKIE